MFFLFVCFLSLSCSAGLNLFNKNTVKTLIFLNIITIIYIIYKYIVIPYLIFIFNSLVFFLLYFK